MSLDDRARTRAGDIAARLVAAVAAHVGRSHEELSSALARVDVDPRDYRMKDGLAKLLEDRCEFEAPCGCDPEDLRRDVFTRASVMRAEVDAGGRLDRRAVLSEIALARGTSEDVILGALFADLRGAEVLTASRHRRRRAGLGLRARPGAGRPAPRGQGDGPVASARRGRPARLFRRLKFLRLLYVITKDGRRLPRGHRRPLQPVRVSHEVRAESRAAGARRLREMELEADVRWGNRNVQLKVVACF